MTVSPTSIHGRRHAPGRLVLAFVLPALVGIAAAVLIAEALDSSSTSEAVRGSGVTATDTRTVSAFGSIEVAGTNDVTVHVGGAQAVVVEGDDNLLENVTTRVDAGLLVVGTTGDFTTTSPLSTNIAVPSLDDVTLSGTGTVTVQGLSEPAVTVTLSGTGRLRAAGSAERLAVTLSGSGDVELAELEARDVQTLLSGTGRIVVTATETLVASLPGTGSITYSGNPAQVTKSVRGTGAIVEG